MKNINRNLTICYFGVNDAKIGKNKLILEGLRQNNIEILDVSIHNPVTRLVYSNDASFLSSTKRILKKFNNLKVLFNNLSQVKKSSCIYVGYPGHFDVPFAYLISKITGVPVFFNPVISLSSAFTNDISIFSNKSFKAKLLLFIERWIYSLPDLILVDTLVDINYYAATYKIPLNKLKILYLGADDSIYKPATTKSKKQTFDVIYYGLYIPIHGVEHILKATWFCKEDKQIRFLLLGNGKTYPEMLELAKKLKLTNVFFYKDANEENSIPILQQADIFLGFMQNNPTVNRAIPNKVFQGLALAKAVITADSPAIRSEFKDRENIYLIPPANPQALAKAIIDLKGNLKLAEKIAQNGYKKYTQKFSTKALGNKLVTIIDEYLKEKTLK